MRKEPRFNHDETEEKQITREVVYVQNNSNSSSYLIAFLFLLVAIEGIFFISHIRSQKQEISDLNHTVNKLIKFSTELNAQNVRLSYRLPSNYGIDDLYKRIDNQPATIKKECWIRNDNSYTDCL